MGFLRAIVPLKSAGNFKHNSLLQITSELNKIYKYYLKENEQFTIRLERMIERSIIN